MAPQVLRLLDRHVVLRDVEQFRGWVDLQVVGVGMISYSGSILDTQVRQKALELAKRDALENYVIDLRAKGAFPPDRYRLYLDHAYQIEEALNRYVTDVVVVDEVTEKGQNPKISNQSPRDNRSSTI